MNGRTRALWAVVIGSALAAAGGPATAAGPLVVTAGGTYRGDWASDDPGTAAVTVRTAEPVVIERSTLRGRGDLIRVVAEHGDVTVRECRGTGVNPGVAGRVPGRFLTAESFDRVVIEHCELDHTAGIYLLTWAGQPERRATVRVFANAATDIDGRRSDGRGGWVTFNERKSLADGHRETGFEPRQFVQLDKVRAPGMEVGWNEVVNRPVQSRVEDNVSVYDSGGTAESPLRIHDNFVCGAYPIDPALGGRGDGRDADWADDWGYSGGGLMLGDGPADTVDQGPSHVRASGNVVVGTGNYGIAIAAGHDVRFDQNRIVSSGLLPDGRAIASQNVGAYVWDAGHGRRRATPTFFDNGGSGNVIGWAKGTGRNDSWTPDAAVWDGTVHLAGPVTPADEAREHADWLARAAQAGVQVGPSH